jgi:hypothetical protein
MKVGIPASFLKSYAIFWKLNCRLIFREIYFLKLLGTLSVQFREAERDQDCLGPVGKLTLQNRHICLRYFIPVTVNAWRSIAMASTFSFMHFALTGQPFGSIAHYSRTPMSIAFPVPPALAYTSSIDLSAACRIPSFRRPPCFEFEAVGLRRHPPQSSDRFDYSPTSPYSLTQRRRVFDPAIHQATENKIFSRDGYADRARV